MIVQVFDSSILYLGKFLAHLGVAMRMVLGESRVAASAGHFSALRRSGIE
jgi:hypothetical protein